MARKKDRTPAKRRGSAAGGCPRDAEAAGGTGGGTRREGKDAAGPRTGHRTKQRKPRPRGSTPAATPQRAARGAELLRLTAFPSATALGLDALVDPTGCRCYLDAVIRDAGGPTDPIEVMMLEQLALAHHRIAQLHGCAGQANQPEAVKVYSAAAARLWGEFRRTALALRLYRGRAPGDRAEEARALKFAQ
jgi:hypothetical protein